MAHAPHALASRIYQEAHTVYAHPEMLRKFAHKWKCIYNSLKVVTWCSLLTPLILLTLSCFEHGLWLRPFICILFWASAARWRHILIELCFMCVSVRWKMRWIRYGNGNRWLMHFHWLRMKRRREMETNELTICIHGCMRRPARGRVKRWTVSVYTNGNGQFRNCKVDTRRISI